MTCLTGYRNISKTHIENENAPATSLCGLYVPYGMKIEPLDGFDMCKNCVKIHGKMKK